jgi:hypothetical protein
MIDICDFAVGLSRQLYGLTMASERPGHAMRETWHPAGVCGIISAFNFPVAVWCWNASLALVCGDPVIWKPSEKVPLCALATQQIFERALARFGDAPAALSQVIIGRADVEDTAKSRQWHHPATDDADGPCRRSAVAALRQGFLAAQRDDRRRGRRIDVTPRAIVFSAVAPRSALRACGG